MDRSYLKIGDGPNMVIGGSTDTAHKRWIDVVAADSLRMFGDAPYQVEFTILKDSASPGLFRMIADGARRATAILDIPERREWYLFRDVAIASLQSSQPGASANEIITFQMTLAFGDVSRYDGIYVPVDMMIRSATQMFNSGLWMLSRFLSK